MGDTKDFMLKLQQLATTATTLWLLAPHELTTEENTYLSGAMSSLTNAIQYIAANSRDTSDEEL